METAIFKSNNNSVAALSEVHMAVCCVFVMCAQDYQSSTQVFLSLKGLDEAVMPVSRGSLRLCS